MNVEDSADGAVAITVVVATHNRPAQFRRLVDALYRLQYPRELIEIILVDDGSEPAAQLHREQPEGGLGIQLLRQENTGPAGARNRGLRAATGQLIAFTDDDCEPHEDWLLQLAAAHAAHPQAMLGGYTRNVLTGDPYAVAGQSLVDHLYAYMSRHSPGNYFFTTSNLAADRARLLALGGFDESFPLPAAEDRDLCDRWKAKGPLAYVPAACVDHSHAMTLSAFLRQQFRYGRGARVLHRKRAKRAELQGQSPRLEGLAFYAGLFRRPFAEQPIAAALRTALLLFVAQVANVLGYAYEARSAARVT